MPYDDDDDLFGEEFDFVDDDDADEGAPDAEAEDRSASKPKKRPAGRDKDKADKSPRGGKRVKPAPPAGKREPRREPSEPKKADSGPAKGPLEPAPVGYILGDAAEDDEPSDIEPSDVEPQAAPAVPAGPPADHLVHIYEFGDFKRTIDRKFTDEEAVSFAEEYTRTGKAYGRYAIATPDDEEPSPTFAGAAKN